MFEYEMRRDGPERVTVQLRGSLVLGEPTERLRECLRTVTDRYRTVNVDATNLKFMDSAGLGDLVRAHLDAASHGGVVELAGATKRIRNLLVLTKLVTVFGADGGRPTVPAPVLKTR